MNNYRDYIGKVLDRRYKILELVGEGGMAVVFKAEDLIMNRLVAIKILNSEYNSDEAMVQRFLNESKAVAMLSHKNIVSIYDVAIYDDMKYIVMEFLDGITLKEYIDSKGILFWKEGCFYAIQILKALEHAHSKGVIHRDIKPQNIMLQKSGEIKVTDFGIAKLPNASSLTVSEKAIGTVYYISPEQASGKKTDFHADLYSVGIMLYEMCTGRLPFVHENAINVAMMQVNDIAVEPMKLNPAIPEGLNQIIVRAMEKEPTARFPSAHGMLKALEVLYNNPDVVFTSGSVEAALPPNVINIDAIATASIGEILPYEGIDPSVFNSKKVNQKPSDPSKAKKKKSKKKGKSGKRKRSLFTGSSHSMFPIILAVWAAFIIVLVSVLATLFNTYIKSFFDGSNAPVEVKIPNLVGKVYDENLVAWLENGGGYGINNKISIDEDNVVYARSHENKNVIIEQSKHGTVNLQDGDEYYTDFTITVSLGPPESVYEDCRLYMKSNVIKKFSEWGIDEEYITVINIPFEDGTVPAVIDPEELKFASSTQVVRVELVTDDRGNVELKDGDIIKEGDYFRIYVYAPETEIEMPDILKMSEEKAAKLLDEKGLVLGEVTEVESELEDGIVIWQSFEQGTLLVLGTRVDVKVSKQCKFMPNIMGLTEMEAKGALIDANILKYRFEYVEDLGALDGTVISVSHQADDPIYEEDSVVVTVAIRTEENSSAETSADISDITQCSDE